MTAESRTFKVSYRIAIALTTVLLWWLGAGVCNAADPLKSDGAAKPEVLVKEIRRLKRGLNTGFELLVENLPASAVEEARTGWVLYFDGHPIDKMKPSMPVDVGITGLDAPDRKTSLTVFQFEFPHDSANQQWRDLFARAGFFRESAITVGPVSGAVTVSPIMVAFKMLMIPTPRLAIAGVFYGVVVCTLVVLGRRSNLLREDNGRGVYAFSLGRSQMAFWFLVVLGGYLFIGVMTGAWIGTIGTQALALMGISAATGVAAAAISGEHREQVTSAPARLADLTALQGTLQAAILNPVNAPNVPVLAEQLKGIGAQLAQLAATKLNTPAVASKGIGLWRDLTSDANGVALHRFQMIVWTIVLGVVFIIRVVSDLVMPELDPTTLALLGITSGTYLGCKLPEKA